MGDSIGSAPVSLAGPATVCSPRRLLRGLIQASGSGFNATISIPKKQTCNYLPGPPVPRFAEGQPVIQKKRLRHTAHQTNMKMDLDHSEPARRE